MTCMHSTIYNMGEQQREREREREREKVRELFHCVYMSSVKK